jgi:hypothetical protein
MTLKSKAAHVKAIGGLIHSTPTGENDIGTLWAKPCEKMRSEKSFGHAAEEEVLRRVDRCAFAPD